MVRADLFDAIDLFMRLNGRESGKPFGGVQILLFGDLYQLPPVIENDVGVFMKHLYQSPYFFDANVMKQFSLEIINLTKVYRQKDAHFVEFLDKVRLGQIDNPSLELINSRQNARQSCGDFITLTPTKKVANEINQERLNNLAGKVFTYDAKIEGEFNLEISNLPVDLELRLKEGAKVIFVKNDIQGRWVNGTLGKVEELNNDYVKVRLDEDSSVVTVSSVDWEKIKYEYDYVTKRIIARVVGKLNQFPLKLAWALTIHKCQGQTLDRIHVDLTTGAWEYGHVYVALSRCRTLEGISLENKIWSNDIKVDTRVSEFLENFSRGHKASEEQTKISNYSEDKKDEKED
jgi:hypothetical protein